MIREKVDNTVGPSVWTDRDAAIVAQYLIDKRLGLEDLDELDYKPE